jgi:F-type H+-transporting ATPase subunit gamma
METLESLRQRIQSTQDLQAVVKTMKSLAAVSIRQYERAAQSLEEYNRVIERGLHIALRNRPEGVTVAKERSLERTQERAQARLGAVIFGSDQGMCGQFNDRIATYAVDRMNGMQIRHGDRSLLTVGVRVTARLQDAHQPIERTFVVPNSDFGITAEVQEVLLHIEGWRSQQNLDRIVLFFNSQLIGAAYEPRMTHLLPLDLDWLHEVEQVRWPSKALPIFRMEWEEIFAALIREHFFVSLYRAFAQSLASENAARLAAMQLAERNIDEKLEEFNARYQQQRQNAITSELLDIVSGFEALNKAAK